MKIIVLGGTGFIGQYLLHCLNEHEIIVPTSRETFDDLLVKNNVQYLHSDYSKTSLDAMFTDVNCLIHLGSMVPNESKQNDFEKECLDNVAYSKMLFDMCVEHSIKNVIFASSMAVYGNLSSSRHKETENCYPNSFYGITKLSIEKIASYYYSNYGIKTISLRIGQGFGARKNPKRPLLKQFQNKALNNERITIYGKGNSKNDYIYVKDIVNAIICALHNSDIHGEFNISNGKSTSVYELANAYKIGFDNDKEFEYVDLPEHIIDVELDISKANIELGWKPKYSLIEATKDMNRIFKSNINIPK